MLTQFHATLTKTAILSLVLIVAISTAWAVNYSSDSYRFTMGKSGNLDLVSGKSKKGGQRDKIWCMVKKNALDDYLVEQNLSSVTLTCDLVEEWVECDDGPHYHLSFEFGPSGAFFRSDRPLEVRIEGKYVSTGCHVWLYGEDGEALESTSSSKGNMITFYVPHFSSYYYEEYNY